MWHTVTSVIHHRNFALHHRVFHSLATPSSGIRSCDTECWLLVAIVFSLPWLHGCKTWSCNGKEAKKVRYIDIVTMAKKQKHHVTFAPSPSQLWVIAPIHLCRKIKGVIIQSWPWNPYLRGIILPSDSFLCAWSSLILHNSGLQNQPKLYL